MFEKRAMTALFVIWALFLSLTSFLQASSAIPDSSIVVGNLKNSNRVGGCICEFQFPAEAKKRMGRYAFISDYGRDGNPGWMNIDGKDVELKMTRPSGGDPEIHVHRVGKKFGWEYEAPEIKAKVDLVEKKTCGAKDSESCEASKYKGTLTVEKNGLKKTVDVVGDCGC